MRELGHNARARTIFNDAPSRFRRHLMSSVAISTYVALYDQRKPLVRRSYRQSATTNEVQTNQANQAPDTRSNIWDDGMDDIMQNLVDRDSAGS